MPVDSDPDSAQVGNSGGEDYTPADGKTKGIVIAIVVLVVALVVFVVGAGWFKRRKNRRAFHALPTTRDARPSTDSAAVPWLLSSSRPISPAFPPSSSDPSSSAYPPSSSFAQHSRHDSDQTTLLPPNSPFLAPPNLPPSPTYSPVVPEGHTSGVPPSPSPSSSPRLSVQWEREEETGQDDEGERRRTRPGLTLAPESLAGSSSVASTAPPPYSPKILGVGSDLGRAG